MSSAWNRLDGGSARLFVALGVTPARELLARAQGLVCERYRGAVPTGERDWHVTLLFIGAVAARAVPGLVETLAQVAAQSRPFPIGFGRLGAFPSARRPRLVYLAPNRVGPEAARLHRRLAAAVTALELVPDARPRFEPHVTLARLTRPGPPLSPWEADGPRWQVESFALVETVSFHGPSRYVERQAFPLQDRDLIK